MLCVLCCAARIVMPFRSLLPHCCVCVLCSWVDSVFIPALNRAGPDGWDMVKVAKSILTQAQADGNKVSGRDAHTAHRPVCVCVGGGDYWEAGGTCGPEFAHQTD